MGLIHRDASYTKDTRLQGTVVEMEVWCENKAVQNASPKVRT